MLLHGRSQLALLGCALLLSGCSAPTEDLSWPLTTPEGSRTISSSFGPRLLKGQPYHFHRGIDLPTQEGSAVLAIAAGVVKRSGHDPKYPDLIVEIEHPTPGQGDCKTGGCFYSNYQHLGAALVPIGQQVEQGQLIAYSGLGETGFPHLHFEIRDGGCEQKFAVHPLRFLPIPPLAPLALTLGKIDTSTPGKVSVEVTVTASGINPDVEGVEVTIADRRTGKQLAQKAFDYARWNLEHPPSGQTDAIQDPDLDGIHVAPELFPSGSPTFSVLVRFNDLAAPPSATDLEVTARATDVDGREMIAAGP